MQTSYAMSPDKAIKGLALCAVRRARPLQLPQLAQILRLTIAAGAVTDDVVVTLTDRKTGQSYSVTADGNADESVLGAAILAAWRGNARTHSLATVAAVSAFASGSNIVIDFTMRHPNREYSLAATGGTGAVTVAEQQAEGGSGLEFGQLVARGANDDEFQALSATTTVRDIAGALVRTDANHFHALENDTADAEDLCLRGKHYPIAEEVEMWVEVAEAVTPSSRAHVRIEASGSNVVGEWGDTPTGTAQVLTITPVANVSIYGFAYSYRNASGQVLTRTVIYRPTDDTTSVADAIAGLEDAAADDAPTGITVSAGGTTEMTLTAAAGTEIFDVNTQVWGLDAEAASVAASLAAADVDMLDVSSIARYTSSAAAGGLAKVKIRLQP